MIQCTDQLGRTVTLPTPAQRIVSLVPSITETLYDLGCQEEVVGITKFCFHPEAWFKSKNRIGGTKTFHVDKIKALQPDLILANKEENDQKLVNALMKDFTVWVSDLKNENDALGLIDQLGKLIGQEDRSQTLQQQISAAIANLEPKPGPTKRVAYMIWQNPIMVAGGDTYIHRMLELCNWTNCFENKNRYPTVNPQELAAESPDLILLSSEPYPFSQKHLSYFQEICPNAVIRLIDGTYFSWYGSRLLPAISYFANLMV